MVRYAFFLATFLGGALLFAQPGLGQIPKTDPTTPEGPKGKGGFGKATPPGELRKYDEVITKSAKSSPGVFAVHRIDDKVYFEIPASQLGKPMLWMAEVAKGPAGVSWGGQSLGSKVIRFERRGNKIYIWANSYAKRADGKAIQKAADAGNMDSIIYTFDVQAEGKDRAAVVNATPLYVSDIGDLSVKGASKGGSIDDGRSWIEEVKTFPTNIEVRSLLTFRGGGAGEGGLSLPGVPAGRPTGAPGRSLTALVHYSLSSLPEVPMQGRYFDPRVGFFTESFQDFADVKGWTANKQYVARFRLEKKDPTAAVSEPVKPIVFYLSPEIPEKLRPFMKKGIEDWQPAFEKAGFKNAIIAKDPPSASEDPNWDPEDARYSVIRWVAEPIANAMGPHVADPRSGETISAHIIFWNDIVKLVQQWYFVQCSASDPKARKLPLPDELVGELVRYVTAHEVGHTIGLRHNHRASSAYTVEQLRNPEFTAKSGTVASIMAYGRYNYVAQPEDKVTRLIPVVGPYDMFAIEWGYRPIPEAKSPDAEVATLDKWASRQIDEPFLRFGGEDGPAQIDPTVKTENIGSDSVAATAMGLKNTDRVLDYLVDATTKTGEDFSLLQDTYKAVLTHRRNWFNAVALNVGGVAENRTLGGRGTESFTRVTKEKQAEAVKFLLDNAFTTPTKMINPAIVSRFAYANVGSEVSAMQRTLLAGLLSNRRIGRLTDGEMLLGDKAYSAIDLTGDLQNGLFAEAKAAEPKADPMRRTLQRQFVDILKSELSGKDDGPASPLAAFLEDSPAPRNTDFRAVARASLTTLKATLTAALPKTKDAITNAHFADCIKEIDGALEGKK